VNQTFELDISGELAATRDESLVLEPARAPADVGRHGNYNNSSLGSHSESPR
jgi:hypothetical protein